MRGGAQEEQGEQEGEQGEHGGRGGQWRVGLALGLH